MTRTIITSTRSELQAYLLELQAQLNIEYIDQPMRDHLEDLAIETLDAINELDRREADRA